MKSWSTLCGQIAPPHLDRSLDQGSAEKDKIQWTRAETFPYNCPVKTFIYDIAQDPER